MSFGAVGVAAGIIALEPAFATGAALGVALVAIGLGISFFAVEQWGLLDTATTIIGASLLAGGVIGFVEADFAGLAFISPVRATISRRNRSISSAAISRNPLSSASPDSSCSLSISSVRGRDSRLPCSS